MRHRGQGARGAGADDGGGSKEIVTAAPPAPPLPPADAIVGASASGQVTAPLGTRIAAGSEGLIAMLACFLVSAAVTSMLSEPLEGVAWRASAIGAARLAAVVAFFLVAYAKRFRPAAISFGAAVASLLHAYVLLLG